MGGEEWIQPTDAKTLALQRGAGNAAVADAINQVEGKRLISQIPSSRLPAAPLRACFAAT